MTIVAAKKFSDRICVLSDTMITDREGTRNNIIPGRLKSIVVNEWLTVSYAGLSIQAIDAVRRLYNEDSISTEFAIRFLLKVSRYHEGALDFIVCSHEEATRLVKISDGQKYEGADVYWIGNLKAASDLSKMEPSVQSSDNLPDYISANEPAFKTVFHDYMRVNRCEGIGGAIIDCLCSPYGHCYITHAAAFSWDTINLGQDDPVERKIQNKTGIYHYEYHVSSTVARGQAIVGFYLNQISIGFIYDPIHCDEAMKIENIGLTEFSELVDYAGKVLSKAKHNKSLEEDVVPPPLN